VRSRHLNAISGLVSGILLKKVNLVLAASGMSLTRSSNQFGRPLYDEGLTGSAMVFSGESVSSRYPRIFRISSQSYMPFGKCSVALRLLMKDFHLQALSRPNHWLCLLVDSDISIKTNTLSPKNMG
jgi:hypothetical protein